MQIPHSKAKENSNSRLHVFVLIGVILVVCLGVAASMQNETGWRSDGVQRKDRMSNRYRHVTQNRDASDEMPAGTLKDVSVAADVVWKLYLKAYLVALNGLKASPATLLNPLRMIRIHCAELNIHKVLNCHDGCVLHHYEYYPAIEPFDFYLMTIVPYSSDNMNVTVLQARSNQLGNKNLVILDSSVISSWGFMIVRDESTKHLWVAFRGTHGTAGKVSGVKSGIFNIPAVEAQKFADQIQKWRVKYETPDSKIYGFVGHSGGGNGASRVLTNWKVWRLSLNAGSPVKASGLYVNFRTMHDFAMPAFPGKIGTCLEYCKVDHGPSSLWNACWKDLLKNVGSSPLGLKWCTLYPGFCGASGAFTPITSARSVNNDVPFFYAACG